MNKEEEENEIKIKNILSNFEISKHMIKKILISTNNVRGFNNFCNSY